ncbi:hypothetical protein HEK616_37100 [Streptomyces nigrescens]|uniref:Secreted protein n=2 Tax=Streptomyces TaxID=1883 RepID=A0ABN6R0W7_STRNI|nr:hypothetical protein [Streptomyces nigrescens]MEE4423543.1 hypothetical protein [Streptomyces sp. DSM 41528]BDM70223.1 hypothetical protein HEK616_37100 [Streptomyces nigrescens]
MDTGDLISAVSALVAAIAAGVGWWQAHSARRAVKAAEEQANAMRDQVKAAEEQVSVMRDQIVLEHMRPRFEVTHATTMLLPRGGGRLVIEVAQLTGVPLDDVKVELHVGSRQVMTDGAHDGVHTCLYSAPGSKLTFRAHLDVEAAQAPAVRVELSGTEAQGTRQWAERLIAHPVLTDNRLLTEGRTAAGLPRRASSSRDYSVNDERWRQAPQVSRAPGDVRGRLANLRRGIQQGRSVGSKTKGQGSGPDNASRQDARPGGTTSGGVAPDAAGNDTDPEDDSSR